MQTLWANNSRISRIKNAKFSGCCFFMNAKQYRDFQICCSVPLKNTSNGCFWIDLIIYDVIKLWNRFSQLDYFLTLSWRRPLSYRNQYIDLRSKSIDWLLYDNSLRHERVNAFLKYQAIKLLSGMGLTHFQFIFLINCSIQIRVLLQLFVYITMHKKWSFPLRFSLVNVAKSVELHLPKKFWMRNFIFCAV